jgi:hypothetical protein
MGKYGKGRAGRIGNAPVQKPPTTAPLKRIEPERVLKVYCDEYTNIWRNQIEPTQAPSAVSRQDRARAVINRELRTPERAARATRIAEVMQSIMDAQGVTQDKLSDDMFIEVLTFCCELGQHVAQDGWATFIGEKSAEFIKRFKEGE